MSLLIFSIVCVAFGLVSFLVVLLYVRDRRRLVAQLPSNRGLFRFNDGMLVRHVDPIDVMMSLEQEKEYSPEIHSKLARNGHAESIRIQCEAIKRAFGVVDYSGPRQPGLTVSEMTRLLYAFWSFVDLQKKSTSHLLISAESTDVISIDSEPQTTSDSSPSGSLGTAVLQS